MPARIAAAAAEAMAVDVIIATAAALIMVVALSRTDHAARKNDLARTNTILTHTVFGSWAVKPYTATVLTALRCSKS